MNASRSRDQKHVWVSESQRLEQSVTKSNQRLNSFGIIGIHKINLSELHLSNIPKVDVSDFRGLTDAGLGSRYFWIQDEAPSANGQLLAPNEGQEEKTTVFSSTEQ
ncbi:Hypothetical predicted protein [Octopus vulgaris]|uniref:Uncharacterized protein n=1 Tax=Octopus vulgaris TaxID=6645 RepID=A0AA36AU99_OCTVU|nr:Hypothetical predicted protein [Octopus vulgaris]